MNWKEQPHLFCNGKFKVDWQGVHRIETWHPTTKGLTLLHDGDPLCRVDVKVNDCQLIARRISDMTDEEIKKLGEFGSSIWDDPSEDLDFYQVVYLLSIGCYPFNQEDFENGEVLDAKEVV